MGLRMRKQDKMQTGKGRIEVSPNVVARVASAELLETYGIVGLTNKNVFHSLADLLSKDKASKGVDVQMTPDGALLDLYVVVQYGTRISEVAARAISRLKYALEEKLGVPVKAINVHIQGVRFADEKSD